MKRKKERKKELLKLGLLLFAIPLLLFNCEKDFEHEHHVEQTEANDNVLSKKPLIDFANDFAFKKVQDFLEINTEQVNQVNLRIKETRLTAKDSSSSNFISLNTKNVVRIVRPTYTSYTFSINQLKQEDHSFRNLIVNVSENKTTAFINTYIPDDSYLQRKLTDKKANFSGKVYFTEYVEDLSSLLKNYKLKPLLSKINAEVCIAEFRVLMWSCNAQLHWPFDEADCKLEGSARAGKTVEVYERCYGGGEFNINYVNPGDLIIEDTLGGGPGGPGTTPLDNVDDDCGGDGYERNYEGECVKYECPDDKKYDEIRRKCVCKDDDKVENNDGKCVVRCETTKDDLKKVFPSTSDSKLKKIVDLINEYGKDFGIETDEELQHFISQAGHEATNPINGIAFDTFEENLNYRWEKLGQKGYWDKYFNPISNPTANPNKADPRDFKRSSTSDKVDVQKFANLVYNRKSLGNTNIGDGYKYRGRGFFQITGKYNYEQFTNFYKENYNSNINFIQNPDLIANNIEIATISALWFFKYKVGTITANTTVTQVTRKINGGEKGLPHRKSLYNKTKINIKCK